jgi:2,5-diamino-6-(ribosylamino)-4(3H)-pyrimidinone 5'-phosphate reductase
MSADGKISSIDHKQLRISGQEDLARVDALRSDSDAIMVGVGTVLADDPGLRVKSDMLQKLRLERGVAENPLRVVADSFARTPPNAKVLGPGCLIAVSQSAPSDRVMRLSTRCKLVRSGSSRVDLYNLMSILYEMGVRRLMVEGGAALNWSLIQSGLVDEIYVYIGGLIIGGAGSPTLVDGSGFIGDFPQLNLIAVKPLDDGVLLKWSVMKTAYKPRRQPGDEKTN